MAMTPDGADQVACGPPVAPPSWFFARRDSFTDFPGCTTGAGLHTRGWAVGGNRRHEAVHMLVIRAHLSANHRLPCGHVQPDLLEPRSDTRVTHDTSILRRTDPMRHQDGDIVARMDIFAHTSDHHCSKPAKQASGNLTLRDLRRHSSIPSAPARPSAAGWCLVSCLTSVPLRIDPTFSSCRTRRSLR
jgi:hypothetical protein